MKYKRSICPIVLSDLIYNIEARLLYSRNVQERVMTIVILFCFILSHSCFPLFSRNNANIDNAIRQNVGNIKITNIPSISKLPVSAVHRVFQDSEGYIWFIRHFA